MTGNYAIWKHGMSESTLLAVVQNESRSSAREVARKLRGGNKTAGYVIREEWVTPIMASVLDSRLERETRRNLKQQGKTDHIADATAYDIVNGVKDG